jgi:hypothetical protein
MPLTEDTIVWTGKSVGITLEVYNNKYSIKGVRSYESQGQTKLVYDWTFPQEYDKEAKSWKAKEKAVPTSLYLGDRDQAIYALTSMLGKINGNNEKEDIPF